MIRTRELQKAIVELLRSRFPTYPVHFNSIEKVNVPSFLVEMNATADTVDTVYFDRLVQVDFTFIPMRDTKGRVVYADLYNMGDDLDVLVRPIFYVENRAITILSAEQTIVDDVLHYIFTLDFADAWTDEEKNRPDVPLVNDLEVNLGGK